MEPEWEARFEPNSYGFRPGRSAHDAIENIYNVIHLSPKYVLDADISKCFDRINHDALLRKIVDILPGLKAPGNNRAVAPRRVDVSQAAATLAVVLHLPPRPFKVSVSPPATNIFLVN